MTDSKTMCGVPELHDEDGSRAREMDQEIRALREQLSRIELAQAEWKSTEVGQENLIAARTAENQFLRSRVVLDRFQVRLQGDDLQKQIALKDAELVRLHTALRELLAEHARLKERQHEWERHEAGIQDLKGQVQELQAETEDLRRALETSLALRFARSLRWLFEPIRKWIA